jgi:hypothetical protein
MRTPNHNRSGTVGKMMADYAEGTRGLERRFLSGTVFDAGWLPEGISAPEIEYFGSDIWFLHSSQILQ